MTPSQQGYFRVASAVPSVAVGDVRSNTEAIIAMARELATKHVRIAVFPELCITGYTCGDLFHNDLLLETAEKAIKKLLNESRTFSSTIIVGVPVRLHTALYNCAAVICNGELKALVPKTYIPNYNEFYEKRWWTSGLNIDTAIEFAGQKVPLSTATLLKVDDISFAMEICEDLWTTIPPSCHLAMAGAEVIFNLSASDTIVGKYEYLTDLVKQQSARCQCAYVYASCGYGESSTDLVFDGIAMIAENGCTLTCAKRWQRQPHYAIADIDIRAIRRDRIHCGSFHDCSISQAPNKVRIIDIDAKSTDDTGEALMRLIQPLPFVPHDTDSRDKRCLDIINIQSAGLSKRLEATHTSNLVIGISGGLDSTLALLVAVHAFDSLGLERKGIIGVTMPGFGTTGRTYNNAMDLMRHLGITIREISICDAVTQHFKDIGHNHEVRDVTYENSQARERTQILMDIANQSGGMVLGTGDLSELALGWATYNGDHMSMYAVNAGVPKTLVRHLVDSFACRAKEYGDTKLHDVLADIIDTPISPELIPADSNDNIIQKTEDLVGPYELHDFFLYYILRFGFGPSRIYYMARTALGDRYDDATIKKWLTIFIRRFFSQQFKRSCLPDGPKVGSVCLSPRGDWRMPSDANSALWLEECQNL